MATQLLLADDSPTIAKILHMALQNEPYAIKAVLTAEEALRDLRASPPTLFLVDLHLPSTNGYEFARLIKKDLKLRAIRVVLLASAFEPVDDAEYAACGADALVKKPFDPSELRAQLRQLLEVPVQFAANSRVTGSISGQLIEDPRDSTRTNLTIGGMATAASTDTRPDLIQLSPESPDPFLTAPVTGGDADSILASLLGNAPADATSEDFSPDRTVQLDLSGGIPSESPSEPILDLTASFGPISGYAPPAAAPHQETPPAPPPAAVPARPPAAPPSLPPPSEKLSPNAEALAAFFEAEIHSQEANKPPPPPRAPPVADADPFQASLGSIDWGSAPADASLGEWSSGASPQAAAIPTPEPTPPRPNAPASRPSSSSGLSPSPSPNLSPSPTEGRQYSPAKSLFFDTGDSTFRFSNDYIQRITKAFSGEIAEEVPEKHAPLFPRESSDATTAPTPRATPPPEDVKRVSETAEARERDRVGGPEKAALPRFGGGAWTEGEVQKIEQIVREEVQMVVREVAEKIAWEIIPELAENLIRKELEKVMKEMEP